MDKDLLNILVCPKTKKKLVIADKKIIDSINQQIGQNTCKDISGEIVQEKFEEGLYQPDTGILYMIRDGIPLLIYDNAIKIK